MWNRIRSFHPRGGQPVPESPPTPRCDSTSGPVILWPGEGDVVADVIFVHGLRGGRIKTWTKGSTCWPRDLLKTDVENIRIISWGYDSSVVNAFTGSSQASIFGHAESLLVDISSHRLRQGDVKSRPIIFVGHSLGGIVIKQALIRSSVYHHHAEDPDRASIYTCTKGIVFLGTPHRGSDKTGLATIITNIVKLGLKQPNSKLIEALKKDSQVLEQQRKDFSSVSTRMRLVCVFEEVPMPVGGIIVPEHSATIDGFGVKVIGVPANHVEMCKFVNSEDIGYRRISDQIMAFIGNNGVGKPEKLSHQDQRIELLAPSPLTDFPVVGGSNTGDYRLDTYSIWLQIVDGSTGKFSMFDTDFVDNKWTESSGITLQLHMANSDSCGSLRFRGETTGEMFSVAVGVQNYQPWCDILTDIEEGATATLITESYYKPQSGKLGNNRMECQKTSAKATSIFLSISQALNGTYAGKLTISDNSVPSGPNLGASGALEFVQVIQGQPEQSHDFDEVQILPSSYKWFSETFKTIEFSRSDIRNALAQGISDLISELEEDDLLGAVTVTALNHEQDVLKKVDILFKEINSRPRDAVLIRSFQRVVARRREMKDFLRENIYTSGMAA